jgi:hypothetical protein
MVLIHLYDILEVGKTIAIGTDQSEITRVRVGQGWMVLYPGGVRTSINLRVKVIQL